MRHRNVFALFGIVILMAGVWLTRPVAVGQTSQDRLTPPIAWVLAEGKPNTEDPDAMQLLGIGNGSAAVQIIQKAYHRKDESIHAFDLVKDSSPVVVVILLKYTDHAILWRTSKAGDIVRTVRVEISDNSHQRRLVPNADYADLFATELKYWDGKAAEKTKTSER